MLVNVNSIPQEGLSLILNQKDKAIQDIFQEVFADELISCDLKMGQLHLEKTDHEIQLHGKIAIDYHALCSRCGKELANHRSMDFYRLLVPRHEGRGINSQEELELKEEDMNFSSYEGDLLHLDEILREELLLQLPFNELCDERCQGLCAKCQKTKAECQCQERNAFSPFSILKDFKPRKT